MNTGGWERFKSTGTWVPWSRYDGLIKRTIDASTVRDEPKLLKLIHEVLKCGVDDIEQSRLDQPFYNPETVPIVLFSETTTFIGNIKK
jgi:hypothetical protein